MSGQIQPYDFQGNTIRTTVDGNGNPLFCAKDVDPDEQKESE